MYQKFLKIILDKHPFKGKWNHHASVVHSSIDTEYIYIFELRDEHQTREMRSSKLSQQGDQVEVQLKCFYFSLHCSCVANFKVGWCFE